MGSSVSSASVLTVHSVAPAQDIQLLQQIFPGKFAVESVDGSDSKLLVGNDGGLAVLLVVSPKPSVVTWVVDQETALEASKRRDDVVLLSTMEGGFVVAEILLSAGSAILMVPPNMVVSSSGRQALVTKMSSYGDDKENCVVPIISNGDHMRDVALGSSESEQDVKVKDAIDTSQLPRFPSLQVGLLGENGVVEPNFPLNSRTAIDVETELFKGKTLFLVRPPNPEDDPYWNDRLFSKRKRRMVIQIQGKFKYEPEGVIYAGAEVSEQMRLGMLVRGLSSMLVKLVEGYNSNVHYSFGDSKGVEKPHIVAPAYTFFERLVATPVGETPPPLDEFFEEPNESISRRKASKSNGEWNTTDTYSFSFYSMYIDLPTWKLVSLPVSGNIGLKTFWGKSLLSICMYEKTGTEKRHLQEFNRYAFAVQAKFIEAGSQARNNDLERDDDGNIIKWASKRTLTLVNDDTESGGNFNRSESQVFPTVMMVEDSDDDFFYDAEHTLDEERSVTSVAPSQAIQLLSEIDSVCPSWIEMCSSRGAYGKAYAITLGNKTTFWASQACKELIHECQFAQVVDDNFSPRMSPSERTRRIIGVLLTKAGETEQVKSFFSKESKLTGLFLKRPAPSMSEKERDIVQKTGFVARAISDRHWVEEWVKITSRCISFYHPEKRKSHFRLPVSNIIGVERLAPELLPHFPGHYFLAIETIGRSFYLMFASENERDSWFDLIPQLKEGRQGDTDSVSSNESGSTTAPMVEIGNPADEFMHNSSMWDCKHRRILNCRQFSLCCQTSGDALQLVENALVRGFELAEDSFDDSGRRVAFLDSVAALKQANVHNLAEDSRLVFFLNLYHVMIIHAFLVLGPPDSALQWISYFKNISYQVSDEIFSITELEHCIIRAQMSYPSQFFSRFVIPKSQYQMALTQADFRINFALNCGSISNPSTIFIYDVDKLDRQLDAASKLYLRCVTATRRSARDVFIHIPRVCQWFAEDFGSPEALMKKIAPYLPAEGREMLASCWLSQQKRFDMSCLTIRHMSFIFECRPLSLEKTR